MTHDARNPCKHGIPYLRGPLVVFTAGREERDVVYRCQLIIPNRSAALHAPLFQKMASTETRGARLCPKAKRASLSPISNRVTAKRACTEGERYHHISFNGITKLCKNNSPENEVAVRRVSCGLSSKFKKKFGSRYCYCTWYSYCNSSYEYFFYLT